MDKNDKKLAVWQDALPRMNEEDLEFILDFPECFEPQVIKMVRTKYDAILKSHDDGGEKQDEKENLVDAVFNALDEIGCNADFDEDNDIQFTYQDHVFYITAVDDSIFISIWEYNWMQVSLNDVEKLSRLRRAINETNCFGDISIVFSVNEECHEMRVHSVMKTLFYSCIPCRELYLECILKRFLDLHSYLRDRMNSYYEEGQSESILN